MVDWATVASLATAGGTLILALATFASVRSSRRAAQATERALLAGLRPVLVPSRAQDPPEEIGFGDGHRVHVGGGHAVADVTDDVIYLAMPLRNVGNGLGVLDGWQLHPDRVQGGGSRPDPQTFQRLTRDLYVPAGDIGFWQGALRDPATPDFTAAREAITGRQTVTVDLLYGDHEGGQRTISRFVLVPDGDEAWLTSVSRHWNLDRADPR